MKRGFLTCLFRLSLATAIAGLFAPSEATAVVTPINSHACICASDDISSPAVEPVAGTPQTATASILSYEALDVCGNDPVNNWDPVGLDDGVWGFSATPVQMSWEETLGLLLTKNGGEKIVQINEALAEAEYARLTTLSREVLPLLPLKVQKKVSPWAEMLSVSIMEGLPVFAAMMHSENGLLAEGGVLLQEGVAIQRGRAAAARANPPTSTHTSPPLTPPKTPTPTASAAKGNVRVFRVEGTPNSHIVIGEGGTVAINDGRITVWLNFGNQTRAEEYLARKIAAGLPNAKVKSFEVPRSVLDDLRSLAVPESMVKTFSNRPIISEDPFPDQYGLRPDHIQDLIGKLIQGSGKEGF